VFENLELALKTDKRVAAAACSRLDSAPERPHRRAAAHHPPGRQRAPPGRPALSHGQKQWLEIGMLLMQDPKLLLLDEPVAGMTDEETERTAELFLTLKGKHSLMVVEHDMSFIKHHQRDRHRAVRRLRAGARHAGPGAGGRARDRGVSWPMTRRLGA
jgi:urea transport system ATP-binding protein